MNSFQTQPYTIQTDVSYLPHLLRDGWNIGGIIPEHIIMSTLFAGHDSSSEPPVGVFLHEYYLMESLQLPCEEGRHDILLQMGGTWDEQRLPLTRLHTRKRQFLTKDSVCSDFKIHILSISCSLWSRSQHYWQHPQNTMNYWVLLFSL